MKGKRTMTIKGAFRWLAALVLLLAAVTAFFHPIAALIELLVSGAVLLLVWRYLDRGEQAILEEMKSRAQEIEAATKGMISGGPLPMVLFQPESDEIIWSNDRFLSMTGNPEHLFDTALTEVIPQFQSRFLLEGKTVCPELVTLKEQRYLVYGNLIDTEGDSSLAITYWVEITKFADIADYHEKSRPVAAVLLIDNYEDLMRGIEESERSVLLSELNKRIKQWAEPAGGIFFRYDRDHYFYLFEQAHLARMQKEKFSLLEIAREVRSPNEITATMSIGIGTEAADLQGLFRNANLSVEMALSRGGDQVVIKDAENYQFFGGKAKEVERRTKVKSRVVANALSEILGSASKMIVMGHVHPDLDVMGAAVGMVSIGRKLGTVSYIVKEPTENPAEELTAMMEELPEYADVFVSHEEALELLDAQTVVVVVDTNRPEQVQLPALLQAVSRVVVVDHHRRAATYIESPVLSFHDIYASSASELVTELAQYILNAGDLLRQEAEGLLSGIVLDTKNFALRTGSRTFEAAAYLRRCGADTTEVKRFFQSDLEDAVERYRLVQEAQLYHAGIAVAAAEVDVSRVTAAKAADELLNISGVEASFVLAYFGDQILLSARSSGDTNVQMIAERLGGGGNAAAAGAQLRNIEISEALAQLEDAIDWYLEEA